MEQSVKQSTGSPKPVTLWILSMIPILMVLGNSMIIPVLPTIRSIYHVSSFQVSLLITLFSIPAAFIIPIAGILSDRIGRKKVIIVSLIIYGIGGLFSAGVAIWSKDSFMLLLLSRIIQGIGAAGTAPVAMVLASDLYKEEERGKALGIIEAANAAGKVLSPIVGALLATLIWYAMFFAFPILTIPLVFLLIKYVTDAPLKNVPKLAQYRKSIQKIFYRQGRWLYVVFFVGLVTMFTMFGVLFYFSEYLEQKFKLAGMMKGFILAIPLLGLGFTAYWTGSHIKERTRKMKHIIWIGLLLLTICTTLLIWIHQFYLLLAILLGIGISSGLIMPCLNTLITSSIGMKERGLITSFYSSVRFLGVALGPPIFGALTKHPYLLFLGTASAQVIAILLVLFRLRQPQRLRGKGERSRLYLHKNHFQST
ncbi:MFS transporter, ACDE family, multidrug resistance protein [Seinonella peptonophila]|uniref:MFS transporter, ACDE family, multidrug resistance protein n=1 Tax=Seinonella peptonophila TaxID=112248 RepID=A0A1M4TN84_9BACL|nr:MFS transporter [Seinonella peptonophila]SHE45921.1 MFS transporter, ACDE family, multidrug resistance protein [Seinonella peptonophila]